MTFRAVAASDSREVEAYKRVALSWLRVYAEAMQRRKFVGGPDTGMLAARGLVPFIHAYDLLRGLGVPRDAPIETWFKSYVRELDDGVQVWNDNKYFDGQDFQNHVIAHSLGYTELGAVLGDNALLLRGLDASNNPRDLVELFNGSLLMPGEPPHHREPAGWPVHAGEIYDRYRHFTAPDGVKGLQYASLSQRLLTAAAESVRSSGADLYGYVGNRGERLSQTFEFYSDFYRKRDSALHDGFYAAVRPSGCKSVPCGSETDRIGLAGDNPATYILAAKRYPWLTKTRELLASFDLTNPVMTWDELLGPVVLSHGGAAVRLGNFHGRSHDGWTLNHATEISGGANYLMVRGTGEDAHLLLGSTSDDAILPFRCPSVDGHLGCSLTASDYEVLRIHLAHGLPGEKVQGDIRVYWRRANEAFSEARMVAVPVASGAERWISYALPLSRHPDWQGRVVAIRIDPMHGIGSDGTFAVDSIELDHMRAMVLSEFDDAGLDGFSVTHTVGSPSVDTHELHGYSDGSPGGPQLHLGPDAKGVPPFRCPEPPPVEEPAGDFGPCKSVRTSYSSARTGCGLSAKPFDRMEVRLLHGGAQGSAKLFWRGQGEVFADSRAVSVPLSADPMVWHRYVFNLPACSRVNPDGWCGSIEALRIDLMEQSIANTFFAVDYVRLLYSDGDT